MVRKNIFEILENKWDSVAEIERIYKLLNRKSITNPFGKDMSPIEVVNQYCFHNWNNRHSYLNIDDMAEALNIELSYYKIPSNMSITMILNYLELASNIVMLCDNKIFEGGSAFEYYTDYKILDENIDAALEHLNFCKKEFEKEERIILVEKNASATAVAEIMDEDTGCKVIEYNHHLLKGNIDKKKEILLQLANKYEGIKSNIKSSNKQLDDNIGFMLNNIHIRHNNKSGKNKKEYVSKMRKDTIEKWYDETYQMLLLAFLLNEQTDRSKKISQLKEKLNNTKKEE